MAKSIISNERRCYICGDTYALEKHHIFAGAFRRKSEKQGCWVMLCPYHHRLQGGVGSNNPIKEIDVQLKREAQKEFEKTHTRDEFMEIFRRNWLDED